MAELVDALDSGSSREFLGGCSSHLGRILGSHTQVVMVANGLIEAPSALGKKIPQHLPLIAIDGGVIACKKMGITPQLIIGDFDSAPPSLLTKRPKLHTPNQNKTDLEKALDLLFASGIKKATVYGALGNRIDHTFKNLHLLVTHPIQLIFKTKHETLFLLPKKSIHTLPLNTSLSLLPVNTPVIGVTTEGLQWNLLNCKLIRKFNTLSNLTIKRTFCVSYLSGALVLSINS